MQIQLASNGVLPIDLPAHPFAENRFAGVLRRVGIGTRLTLVFSLLLALLCGALLGSSLHGERTRAQLAAGMATAQNKRLYTTELEVKIGVQQLAIRALGLAFDGVPTLKRSEQAGRSLDEFVRVARAAQALGFGPVALALIKQIEALSLELQAPFKSAVEQSMVQNAFGAAELIAKEIEPRQQKQLELIKQLAKLADADAVRAEAQSSQASAAATRVMLALMGLALAICAAAAFVTTRSVTGPLRDAVALIQQVAKGNLAVSAPEVGNDEATRLGESVNRMAYGLRQIVHGVREGSIEISNAASELARGNADLSKRTEHQATNLGETASALERLTATVRHTADNVSAAQGRAAAADTVARSGHQKFSVVAATMGRIAQHGGRQVF